MLSPLLGLRRRSLSRRTGLHSVRLRANLPRTECLTKVAPPLVHERTPAPTLILSVPSGKKDNRQAEREDRREPHANNGSANGHPELVPMQLHIRSAAWPLAKPHKTRVPDGITSSGYVPTAFGRHCRQYAHECLGRASFLAGKRFRSKGVHCACLVSGIGSSRHIHLSSSFTADFRERRVS
jgi:hypothetical protein